ncbi:hypothetical protein PVAP13_5NG172800 [Panicum virgatum]|uniref:Uncharacterized protein n=1 Tax=Panicum virgatum TaxID=38727 RepID=A0A8T0RTJ7_PANVG|nr:hypothetical protein PVAP13_5NG172800 [Panicum virgatum]
MNIRTTTATKASAMRMFSSTGSRHTFPMLSQPGEWRCRGSVYLGFVAEACVEMSLL